MHGRRGQLNLSCTASEHLQAPHGASSPTTMPFVMREAFPKDPRAMIILRQSDRTLGPSAEIVRTNSPTVRRRVLSGVVTSTRVRPWLQRPAGGTATEFCPKTTCGELGYPGCRRLRRGRWLRRSGLRGGRQARHKRRIDARRSLDGRSSRSPAGLRKLPSQFLLPDRTSARLHPDHTTPQLARYSYCCTNQTQDRRQDGEMPCRSLR